MKKIEHLGIAVKDIETSNTLFEKLLGVAPYKQEAVASEGVLTSFFQNGPNKIELLASTDVDGPIAKFLEKKGEGIHHVAFEVDDIVAEMARLKSEGFTLLNEKPKKGADNKWVAFVHPKSANGMLVELCQEASLKNE
ncbi:methylmalonyl-CoA epimerase [Maribacter sp. ACAM166]|uniref:methylmalonyl-CoA epimerase n=1 Tax=Maribacter sp. ACAM166 TaxID=2508996 RepID=UPI0010FD03E4|nr:methylmalonyl-CoA epimerase [Maribacter sp. ACAM166]TLP75681.1 methylmalonyl-CoA epimerase [Maribacter sp. ACAM166]